MILKHSVILTSYRFNSAQAHFKAQELKTVCVRLFQTACSSQIRILLRQDSFTKSERCSEKDRYKNCQSSQLLEGGESFFRALHVFVNNSRSWAVVQFLSGVQSNSFVHNLIYSIIALDIYLGLCIPTNRNSGCILKNVKIPYDQRPQ